MKKALPILALLFSVTVWGISFISTKILLLELPPVTIALCRQIPALLSLLVLLRLRKESLKLTRKDMLLFPLASLFGIVLYATFENIGLQFTSASTAAMLVATIPVFVLLSESVLAKQRMSLQSMAFILASVIGVYFVLFEDGVPDFSTSSFLGNAFVFAAMVAWIVYTFMNKRIVERHSSLKMTTLQTMFSIPIFLPLTIPEMKNWQVPSFEGILHLLFLGVCCSALAYVFYFFAIKKLGPVIPSAFLNLLPLITIVFGAMTLNESITWLQGAGAVLIIGSLTALTFSRRKSKHQEIEKAA
jgi:drug/metabolite transporter (DMT)-like permease